MNDRDSNSWRLLLLAPNWLGDVVMHTPLLSYLDAARGAVSQATGRKLEIHLGIRAAWGDLFDPDERLDGLVILDRHRQRGAAGTFRLAGTLRRGQYDGIILCPPSFRTGLAAWLARIPARVGYRSDGRSLFLTRALRTGSRGRRHYSREMIHLGTAWLGSLGIEAPDLGLVEARLPGCDAIAGADLGPFTATWAVAPGTTYGEAKTWPTERVADFIQLAVAQDRTRVVLVGDKAARGFTRRLRERFPASWDEDLHGEAMVVDLTGKTDLNSVVGILKSSAAFVGNDSGLMHLAGALGVPTLGIFGSSNPDWTSPLGPRTEALVAEGFDCRPCYRKTCNQPVFCLDTVSPERVLGAVRQLVDQNPAAREGV